MKIKWKQCRACDAVPVEPGCPYCEGKLTDAVVWKAMPGTSNCDHILVENGLRNVAYLSHVMPGDLKKFEAIPELLAACQQAEAAMTAGGHSIRETIAKLRAAIAKAGEVL